MSDIASAAGDRESDAGGRIRRCGSLVTVADLGGVYAVVRGEYDFGRDRSGR